jgi:hypothetical protein
MIESIYGKRDQSAMNLLLRAPRCNPGGDYFFEEAEDPLAAAGVDTGLPVA